MSSQNKAAALARMAMSDRRPDTERNIARDKLRNMLEQDASLGNLADVRAFLEVELESDNFDSLREYHEPVTPPRTTDSGPTIADMMRRGFTFDGSWTGATTEEAARMMMEDLDYRMRQLFFERMVKAAGIPDDASVEDVLNVLKDAPSAT